MILLRAPLARGLTKLDRSVFSKTVILAAASVKENKNISKYRNLFGSKKALFEFRGVSPIRDDPSPSASKGAKCLLLSQGIKLDVPDTWGEPLHEGIQSKELDVIPYELKLGYDDWSNLDVIGSILPDEFEDDYPTGYNTCGHIAHLNLRDKYLPYKHIIAEVLLDKSPNIRTVINKVDTIGESEYRTFTYEVLAGPDEMEVEVKHLGCVFSFDYSQVYWNSKLDTEHARIVDLFKPGEVVCDVMAGIGPFAVPAGKKGVFVWANDKNPESFKYLQQAVKRNKVSEFVRPFNRDGREFIWQAADLVYEASTAGEQALVQQKRLRGSATVPEPIRVPIPPTISHFVLNLPGSATTFIHNFKGLYAGREELFAPATSTPLPLVHVHCFSQKAGKVGQAAVDEDICQRLHEELGIHLDPTGVRVDAAMAAGQVMIHHVRDVAPNKSMYCASFRIPLEVAFAPRGGASS